MTKKISFILIYLLFIFNLITYSLSYRNIGNDNLIWIMWSFSQYITFFVSLKISINVTSTAVREKKAITQLIYSVLYIIMLILGYYISVVNENFLLMVFTCFILISILSFIHILIKINKNIDCFKQSNKIETNFNIDNDLIKHFQDKTYNNNNKIDIIFTLFY